MSDVSAFNNEIALKYQLYDGLFLSLPFEDVRNAGILLPVFTSYCREHLERGDDPRSIVLSFFDERVPELSPSERIDYLFRFMQIVERQVVLFDALEDAAFARVNNMEGPGTLTETLSRVEEKRRWSEYRKLLDDYRVRVVLTAHPTQFYPDDVLSILNDLADAVAANDTLRIYELLLQMGKTRFRNKEKPTPLDEATSLLWYMENVFYEAFAEIQKRLVERFDDHDAKRAVERSSVVELGFWPGGDRDGNPFVTSDLTVRIAGLLRSTILRLYHNDLKKLMRRLTFPGITEKLHEIHKKLRKTVSPTVVVNRVAAEGLEYCEDRSDEGYTTVEELLGDLVEVFDLVDRDHQGLFNDRVADLIYKVRVFGFHFAAMDIRQDSRVHQRVVAEILRSPPVRTVGGNGKSYDEMSVDERIETMCGFAEHRLDTDAILEILPEGVSRDAVLSLRAARHLQVSNGTRGVHRYVISNTQSAANVFEVWFLACCAGWPADELTLDIVPLFETVEDLHNASSIMETLYDNHVYQSHLARRSWVQTIMLGFSDGTKDGGYVTANWEIFKAKQRLTRVARERQVSVVFFDGRGGPPARGGGNTHKFYRTFGRSIDAKEVHLTVQGQTISSKYGTHDAARYNMEQLVSAGIETHIFPEDHIRLTPDESELLDILSAVSCESYLRLRKHPDFVSYLETMTPLRFYSDTNIASRPTSRSSGEKLVFEDLRAIPFVGAWSQMKQNVPGFYGFGSGLEELFAQGRREDLKRLYGRSLFFRTLVENAMQSLSKTYFPLTSFVEQDSRFGPFWRMVRDEAELTREMLLAVSGQSRLLETDRVIRRSIRMREEIILPVLVIQQYAMTEIRRALPTGHAQSGGAKTEGHLGSETRVYEKMVVKSLAAAVNAGRNAV